MIPSTRVRRTVAALAFPAVLLATAACGSEDSEEPTGPAATVSGAPGEQPTIEIDADAGVVDEPHTEVLREGDGPKISRGDFLYVNVVGTMVEGEQELVNTWGAEEEPPPGESPEGEATGGGADEDGAATGGGEEGADAAPEEGADAAPEDGADAENAESTEEGGSAENGESPAENGGQDDGEAGTEGDAGAEQGAEAGEDEGASGAESSPLVVEVGMESTLPEAVSSPLIDQNIGSRVKVEGSSGDLFGPVVEQTGTMTGEEGLVWVLDVVEPVPVASDFEGEQATPEEGMPEVEIQGQEPATITIPEGEEPPEELREQVLIEGDGAEVEAGDTLIAHYTGVNWEDGEPFDSSRNSGGAAMFPIGGGQVIPAWDEALVGKHVGDRVLLVAPPDMAYGDQESEAIPANSTLVFVVDIIGVD